MPIFEIEANGRTFEVDAPDMQTAAAAVSAPSQPKQATPPPASATIGMIAPSTATSKPATGTLMDLVPPKEQRHADMQAMVDAAPMAVPVPAPAIVAGAKGIPGVIARAAGISKARAGANIAAAEEAARAAGSVVDAGKAGMEGLRSIELKAAGAKRPDAVVKFMERITNPDLGDLSFKEARDFYSTLSQLSAGEMSKMKPVMARVVANMKNALGESLQAAAESAGKGEEYASGIGEYARASKAAKYGKNAAKVATGAGAGYLGLGWLRNYLQ